MNKANWISKAIKKKGALHKALGIKEGKKIPASKLKVKPSDSPRLAKQKNLAKTLKKISRRK